MKYFNRDAIKSSEDLKRRYRAFALELHPDRGGNAEHFREMKSEYDFLFDEFNGTFRKSDGTIYTTDRREKASKFTDIIDALVNYSVTVDIVGSWLWIYGPDTYKIKEMLKAFGFRWSRAKKKWYLNGNGYQKKTSKSFSYDELKSFYGCENIIKNERLELC